MPRGFREMQSKSTNGPTSRSRGEHFTIFLLQSKFNRSKTVGKEGRVNLL